MSKTIFYQSNYTINLSALGKIESQEKILSIPQDYQAGKVYQNECDTCLEISEIMKSISEKCNEEIIDILSRFVEKYPGSYYIHIKLTLPRKVKHLSLYCCSLNAKIDDLNHLKAWYFRANTDSAISRISPDQALTILFSKIQSSQCLKDLAYSGLMAEEWFDFSN